MMWLMHDRYTALNVRRAFVVYLATGKRPIHQLLFHLLRDACVQGLQDKTSICAKRLAVPLMIELGVIPPQGRR